MGGQEFCCPLDWPCWEEARLLLLDRKPGFHLGKGRGVGWGSLELSLVSCEEDEQTRCCELSRLLTASRGEGEVLAFASWGEPGSKQEYMQDPPGMGKERKQGPLELTSVKELQLDSMEQAEGKSAFPIPTCQICVQFLPPY